MRQFTLFVVLIALAFSVSAPISAQTATPTPGPLLVCSRAAEIGSIIFNFLASIAGGGVGSEVTCPSNQINPAELENIYRQLREAADRVNALPDEINSAGPGATLLDVTAGVGQIAGYVKWLFSANSAQELLGKTFAPIGINIMVLFLMTVAMVAIYISINTVVFTIKMVVWLVNQILKLLPFW